MSFNLLNKEYLKNIDTTAFLYEHDKTKAKLLFFSNNDENKSFSITFKTIPNSDNGIFHILEHSVLCGSEKYPVKEPFVELIKGSFNTFINAMTFPDKTMYPVSSKNDEDLNILMDIYLDAVFNPRLLKDEKILKQEGWHYHLEKEEDDLIYKGVVYNEMKGVYSSIDEIVDMHISENLYKDTEYRFSYGGKPNAIPTLTQKEFVSMHNFCYHPSNSYIFLYGNLEINNYLEQIDNYLNKYNFRDYKDYQISKQKTFNNKVVNATYYNAKPNNKNYVTVNYLLGTNADMDIINSISIIDEILLGNPSTTFRKYFIDNEIAEDVYSYLQRDRYQVAYSIIFKNVKDEYVEQLADLYQKQLSKEIITGFDEEYIQSIINKNIFNIKEEVNKTSSPKGVTYAIRSLRNWLYGDNPLASFYYDKIINILNDNLTNNKFEEIANKYLLNNSKKVIVNIKASKNKEEEIDLTSYRESLKKEEIDSIISDTNNLLEWQNSKDSKEDLDKIKSVEAKNVILKNPYKATTFSTNEGVEHAHYDIHTADIIYSKLLFDISSFNQKELQYSALLSYLLFNINTINKTEIEVQKEIDNNLGAINSNINIFKNDQNDNIKIKFIISAKNLNTKTSELANILKENTLYTNFNGEKTIYNILLELKLNLETRFKESGHSFVNRRIASYFSLQNKLTELINGYDFYIFLKNLVDNFSNKYSELKTELELITKKIFNKNNLLISVTSNSHDYEIFSRHILNYVNKLKPDACLAAKSEIEFSKKITNFSEAFYFDTQVNYVGYGFDDISEYTGSLLVLRHILNFDYLWNSIRVKGGAYGTGITINKFKEVGFWSYRDPNLIKTLEVYTNVTEYIKKLNLDEKTLNKYIIGTLNSFNQLMTPSEKSNLSLNSHINNSNPNDYNKLVKEIKETKLNDLLNLAEIFDNKNSYKCVITSKELAEEHKDIFSEIIEIK